MKDNSAAPTVLIFKETLLPVSETFIEAQARYLTEFVPRYIGLGRTVPSLAVPADSILLTSGQSTSDEFRQKLYRRTGFAPGFHRRAAAAQASLLHAHFASGGRSALPLARTLRIPLVVTLHGADVTTNIDFRTRYQELWNEAAMFVCVSGYIRRKAEEAGFPKDKLTVEYIGIDRDVFSTRTEPRQQDLVVFVGRLVEKKGCSFFLQALAEVQKGSPGVRAVVIGDGPLRSSLEALAANLSISCQFLGAQRSDVVRKWLASARVFCAPSIAAQNGDSEGLGMVFAEAQAMGTPVASFRHGGIPEVVLDGKTGLLAPEGDTDALAKNITCLLQDDRFWQGCVTRGIDWIRTQFDIRTRTQRLERVYAGVCN